MTILSYVSNFILNDKNETQTEISKTQQVPFPKEVFSYLTLFEINQLGLSCKGWHNYTSLYIKTLKKQIKQLYKTCENKCFIPAHEISGFVNCIFTCNLMDDKIVIQESRSDIKPDFYINAKIDVLNFPFADDAIDKTIQTLFRSCICVDFACVIFKEIQSVNFESRLLTYNQRRQIMNICKSVNIYLDYRRNS